MAKKPKPQRRSGSWIPAVLVMVLIVLVGALWLAARQSVNMAKVRTPVHVGVHPKPVTLEPAAPSLAPKSPVFEDYSKAPEPSGTSLGPETYLSPTHVHGLALILDDVGYDLPELRRALALPYTMAISVMPDTPYAKQAADMAHAAGRVVMLHMPMEPDSVHYQKLMDGSFLRAGMSDAEIRSLLLNALSKVPYVQGMNNHMGSLLTSMADPMSVVMEVCREKHLFFVDSRTTAASVAATMAKRAGIPWASRRIFLDNKTDPASLQHMWNEALACEQRHGVCVVIAHPHPKTLDFLEQHTGRDKQVHMLAITDVLHTGAVARTGG